MTQEALLIDEKLKCHHCGEDCPDDTLHIEEKHFCCTGCQTVYEILQENNLCTYYDLNANAGVSLKAKNFEGKFDYLLSEHIQEQLLDYKSDTISKITFYIPSIHCSSCVWLLENLNRVRVGVINTRLNFVKKELAVSYNPLQVSLKEIVALLATLGYEPLINLESGEKKSKGMTEQHRLILKIGVVGFCMGNIMLLSFPEYFKLDLQNAVDAQYQKFFLYLNFLLSLPVFFFGAIDYIKGAWISIKENLKRTTSILSVDIPIALGIVALFCRSIFETFVNQSAGYWDSLAGLVFFLLVGKWVQQTTFNYLSFERNYKSYFPLAVKVLDRLLPDGFAYINVSELKKNDIVRIHHQEIIPADSILTKGSGLVDYSFVTGESVPVRKEVGELIYAGGRQMGDAIELTVQKPVSQSYLTQLWNNDSFEKEKEIPTTILANAFSKYFTYITLAIAALTGIYWQFNNPSLVWTSLTAVLMVACPCALTLSMPFTMGSTMTIFGRNKFYVKNQGVIQLLTEIDEIVFDKTGTLTSTNKASVHFEGIPLTQTEKSYIKSLVGQSTHPLSKMVDSYLAATKLISSKHISDFKEVKGEGVAAVINGELVKVGSEAFVKGCVSPQSAQNSQVHVAIGATYKGYYIIEATFRNGWENILNRLKKRFKLSMLSGDNAATKATLAPYFDVLRFEQKPQDKLNFIQEEQVANNRVLMIGDGLNDAGALRQSTIGIAITEDTQAFSPACDAILDASQFGRIGDFLSFSKVALNTVKASFVLSLVYNTISIGWAASGVLSPVMAAIFMPLSTITVVLFAVTLMHLFAKKRGF